MNMLTKHLSLKGMIKRYRVFLTALCMALVGVTTGFANNVTVDVNQIATLSIRDYSTTGANIYNELLAGSLYATSSTWTSSDPSATTWVDKTSTFAYVKFTKTGSYRITQTLKCTYSGATKFYTFDFIWDVNVTGATGIDVSTSKSQLYVGETVPVYATVYGNGSSANVTWSSSTNSVSVSAVNAYQCNVTGKSEGTARVIGRTSNGLTDYVDFTVLEHNKITVSPSTMNLTVGDIENVSAEITGSNSSVCKWTSSNNGVVAVNLDNYKTTIITAMGPGTATLTATAYDGSTAKCTVTVTEKAAVSTDLYVVGALTGWECLEDFKLEKSVNGEEYSVYLDYLGGEFVIASPDMTTIYSGSYIWNSVGESQKLTLGSKNYMKTGGPWVKPYIQFNPSTGMMKMDIKSKPIGPDTQLAYCYLSTALEGGYICMVEPVGSRFCFAIDSDEGWIAKAWICSDEVYEGILVDVENGMYLSPVIKSSFGLGVYFENATSVQGLPEDLSRVTLRMTPDAVRLINLPEGVNVTVADKGGVVWGQFSPADSTLDLRVPKSEVFVISLSNGQQFKVRR